MIDVGDKESASYKISLEHGIAPYTSGAESVTSPEEMPGLELVMRQYSVRAPPHIHSLPLCYTCAQTIAQRTYHAPAPLHSRFCTPRRAGGFPGTRSPRNLK